MTAMLSRVDFLRALLPERTAYIDKTQLATVRADTVALVGWGIRKPEGWRTASRHLLLPHEQRPRLLLPRRPRLVLNSALRLYRPGRRVMQFAQQGAGVLAKAGVIGQLPWREMMVLERGDSSPPGPLWQDVTRTLPSAAFWAASTGTPGPFRKASLRIMAPTGRPLAQVKVGSTPAASERIEAEVAALQSLAMLKLEAAVPALLGAGHHGQHRWLIQQHLGDLPAAARPTFEQVARFGDDLSAQTSLRMPLRKSSFWMHVEERFAMLPRSAARRGWELCCANLAERSIDLGASHGDLAPWNVMLREGRMLVFDWETFDAQSPALLDVFHWLVFAPLLMGETTASALASSLLNGRLGVRLSSRTGTDVNVAELLALYLVDRVAQLEVEQRQNAQTGRAEQIQRLAALLGETLVACSGWC